MAPGVALFHQRITMALTIISDAADANKVIAAVKDSEWEVDVCGFGGDEILALFNYSITDIYCVYIYIYM